MLGAHGVDGRPGYGFSGECSGPLDDHDGQIVGLRKSGFVEGVGIQEIITRGKESNRFLPWELCRTREFWRYESMARSARNEAMNRRRVYILRATKTRRGTHRIPPFQRDHLSRAIDETPETREGVHLQDAVQKDFGITLAVL